MVMPVNRIDAYSKFYVRIDMCYDTHCRTVEVPWVRELELSWKMADIAILDDPSGRWKPGLYVRYDQRQWPAGAERRAANQQQWRLAMTFEDVCRLLVTANHIDVVVTSQHTKTYDDSWLVFKNAQDAADKTIRPSEWDVWVAVLQEAEANTKIVTKDDKAMTDGIFQVSDGPDRTIRDWAPSPGGFAIVGPDGKAAIAKVDTEVIIGDGSAANPFTIALATDNKPGIAELNLGTDLPADATNCTDALTACGLIEILENKPNELSDAVAKAITVDPDVISGSGTVADPYSVVLATDTMPGIVELNLGTDLPADATNCTDALTACGLIEILKAKPNDLSDAVSEAITVDTDVISGSGTVADPYSVVLATDTMPGIVELATGNDYPDATNDVDATTPAYVHAAMQALVNGTVANHAPIAQAAADRLVEDAADPKIALMVGANTGNSLSLRTLRSLGNRHLGHVVIGVV